MPEKDAHQFEAGSGMDFQALELEIDREIDSLFVPRVQKADTEAGPNDIPEEKPDFEKSKSVGGPETSLDLNAIEMEIDKEIDSLFVPSADSDVKKDRVQAGKKEQPEPFSAPTSQEPHEDAPPGGGFDSQTYNSPELSGLIEIFNAAYLSLDWEFTRENLQKFIAALHQLEPFASTSSDAKSVFKIMDVILKRLRDRPRAVNSKLIQLIRDSQGLLAHILLVEGETGANEKRRLKDLIGQFQDLRQRALAVKAQAKGPNTSEDTSKTAAPIYIDSSRTLCEEGPVPNLSTPPERPASDKADPLAGMESRMQAAEPVAEHSAHEKTDSAHPAMPVPGEDAYLVAMCGKCLVLPASSVVKVARSPDRKGLKILKRGYATLADFTPSFRRVKSGVLGEWTRQPAKELKSYRFEPSGYGPPDQAVTSGPLAVLASDGQMHRVIFCETVTFIADAEIASGPSSKRIGSLEIKSHLLVPVFDLRCPFSASHEAGAPADQ